MRKENKQKKENELKNNVYTSEMRLNLTSFHAILLPFPESLKHLAKVGSENCSDELVNFRLTVPDKFTLSFVQIDLISNSA